MTAIVTLTPNPAIDLSTAVERVAPIQKLRCAPLRRDPGGGGINVARVIHRLGGQVAAVYAAGGATGALLCRLLNAEGIASIAVAAEQETRENFTVLEQDSGNQYRFVLPGTTLSDAEWRECLQAIVSMSPPPRFIVGSGSLPPGVPDDFYAQAAKIAKACGAQMVLDTAGAALACGLSEAVYLVKPNRRELQNLVGHALSGLETWIRASRSLVDSGRAEVVALTLADAGALLVTANLVCRARTPAVKITSAVGAGDSFLGGMMWSLAAGDSLIDAFRSGVAAGTAAVLKPGTELCDPDDVLRLREGIELEGL